MTDGVSISLFVGVMDLLAETSGERMCGESLNGFLPALQGIVAMYESLPKCETERTDDDKLSHVGRLVRRALDISPEGEVRELLVELSVVVERVELALEEMS